MMRKLAAILAVVSAAALPAAEAASLNVKPVLLALTPPANATKLTLSNGEAKALTIQARVFRWTQVDGEDRLTRTEDVAVSPPITTLAPEGQGLFRIVRVAGARPEAEESYRVFVDQIPDRTTGRGATLDIAVRYSIPLFVTPAGLRPPDLAWEAKRAGDRLILSAENADKAHAKLTKLTLRDANGHGVIEREGLVGYVLPGGRKTWSFRVAPGAYQSGSQLSIEGEMRGRPLHTDVTIR